MKQRIITGLVFTAVMALFVVPGYWYPVFPLLLLVIVHIIAAYELTQAFRDCNLHPIGLVIGSGVVFLPLAACFSYAGWSLAVSMAVLMPLLAGLMILSSLISLIIHGPDKLPAVTATAGLLLYLSFPLLSAVFILFFLEQGWLWFVMGLITPWLSDVFAYFAGSTLGRHKIVPRISPQKTVEGFLGGLLGTMLILGLAFRALEPILQTDPADRGLHLVFALVSAVLLSLAAQAGDWLASGIKRWCGIKDFGHLLPGHGGIMDRFDSALLTLPLTLALAVVYNLIF